MFGTPSKSVDSQDGLKEQQRKYINVCVIGQPSTSADPATGTLCKYDSVYTTGPILDNPKEWVVGIDRFNIPMLRVPRFIDPSTQGAPAVLSIVATSTNLGVNTTDVYSATVQMSGVLTPDPFNTGYVYLVSQWVAAMNAALATATNNLTAAKSFSMVYPLLVYNASTGIITLMTQAGTFGASTIVSTGGTIYVLSMYFNASLWRYLPTLPQVFFNYSSTAAPLNTSTFYSKVTFAPSAVSATLTVHTAYDLPTFFPQTGPALKPSTTGILTTPLVAGTSYTQLKVAGLNLWYLTAGQAIVLADTVSGTQQTVFVAEGDCAPGAVQINTLLFTAVFAFPANTTSINIYSNTAVVLNAGMGAVYPIGTEFAIGGTSYAYLSRPSNFVDLVLYVTPVMTRGEAAGSSVALAIPSYDSISTESPVPPIWTSISSVRVKSTKIPIALEFSPDILSTASTTTTAVASIGMITDFVIDTSNSLQTADLVQFVTDNPRWIDLLGDMPLYTIDLIVVWVDYQGNEHPVYIPAGYRFDMKLNFKRKYTKCLPGF